MCSTRHGPRAWGTPRCWNGSSRSRSRPHGPAAASLERFAALPASWRLSDFDFDAQPSVDRALIYELGTLRFLEDATNVLFIGPPGVGKTMLAVTLGRAAVEAGHRVHTRPPPSSPRAATGRRSRAAGRRRCASTRGQRCPNRRGGLPAARDGGRGRVVPGHHPELPAGFGDPDQNLGIATWGRIFDDPTVAAAMLDRLLHRSVCSTSTVTAIGCGPTGRGPRSSARR